MEKIKIIKPGLFTTIQDKGKMGVRKIWHTCSWSYG